MPDLLIAPTYAEYRKQKCEWCAKGLVFGYQNKRVHLESTVEMRPNTVRLCTAPSRDTYEAELFAEVERLQDSNEEAARVLTNALHDGAEYGGSLNSLALAAAAEVERLGRVIEAAPCAPDCSAFKFDHEFALGDCKTQGWCGSCFYPKRNPRHNKVCNCWKAALAAGKPKEGIK